MTNPPGVFVKQLDGKAQQGEGALRREAISTNGM